MTNLEPLLRTAGVVPLADLFTELGLNRHERRRCSATNTWPTVAITVPVQADQPTTPPPATRQPRVIRIAKKEQR